MKRGCRRLNLSVARVREVSSSRFARMAIQNARRRSFKELYPYDGLPDGSGIEALTEALNSYVRGSVRRSFEPTSDVDLMFAKYLESAPKKLESWNGIRVTQKEDTEFLLVLLTELGECFPRQARTANQRRAMKAAKRLHITRLSKAVKNLPTEKELDNGFVFEIITEANILLQSIKLTLHSGKSPHTANSYANFLCRQADAAQGAVTEQLGVMSDSKI